MSMKPDDTRAPEARRRRWPTVLLAVSLTANLLVLGLVAGAHFRDVRDARAFPPPDRSVMRSIGFSPFFDAMPRDARNRLGEALRNRDGHFVPDRAALAAEMQSMIEALRAEPFEPGKLEALLTAQHDRANARIIAGREVLLEQVAAMSPKERRDFADQLEGRFSRALQRGPQGHDDDD